MPRLHVGPRLHHRAPIGPASGPIRRFAPSGSDPDYDCSVGPRLGCDCAVRPRLRRAPIEPTRIPLIAPSGPPIALGPRSGPLSPRCTVGPARVINCTIGPQPRPNCTVGPRSGPIALSGAPIGPRLRRRAPISFAL